MRTLMLCLLIRRARPLVCRRVTYGRSLATRRNAAPLAARARFTIPADAILAIEHEREEDDGKITEEVELQLRWSYSV